MEAARAGAVSDVGIRADTFTVDMSAVTSRPLTPMLANQSITPEVTAHPNTDALGATTNFWTWGIESSDALRDKDSGKVECFLATYVLPYEGNLYFVGHSLHDFPEPLIRLMSDPDTGPPAQRLVEQHLRSFAEAWRQGRDGLPLGWGLIKVRTDRDYWFFAAALESRSSQQVDIDQSQVSIVQDGALAVLGDVLGFPGNLPGILDVLPPDRRAARLKEYAEVLNAAAGLLKDFSDLVR